jgi:hypothetical protein
MSVGTAYVELGQCYTSPPQTAIEPDQTPESRYRIAPFFGILGISSEPGDQTVL